MEADIRRVLKHYRYTQIYLAVMVTIIVVIKLWEIFIRG